MKILTAVEMEAVDRRTAEEFGVSVEELMEAAGGAVASFCLRQYPAAMRVVILCGKGNNGGDGFVAARRLGQAGLLARVVLLGQIKDVKGEAETALQRLREEASAIPIDEIADEDGLTACRQGIKDADLLLDALVGTGFKPPLRGLAVSLRDFVEELRTPVVAVDLPSGWDANSTEQRADGAFRADAVVTFTAPKMAHVFGHLTRNERTGGVFGPVVVAPIGSPVEAIVSSSGFSWAGASKVLAERPRDVNTNKGRFGHVLVVGGCYGKGGSAGDGFTGLPAGGSGVGDGGSAEEHCGYGDSHCA